MPETNDERFHRRQREMRACRCAECRAHYEATEVRFLTSEEAPVIEITAPESGYPIQLGDLRYEFVPAAIRVSHAPVFSPVLPGDIPPPDREITAEDLARDKWSVWDLALAHRREVESTVGSNAFLLGASEDPDHPCAMRDTPGGRCCSVCGRFE